MVKKRFLGGHNLRGNLLANYTTTYCIEILAEIGVSNATEEHHL